MEAIFSVMPKSLNFFINKCILSSLLSSCPRYARLAAVSLFSHSVTGAANYFKFDGLHVLELKEQPNPRGLSDVP